MLHVRGAGRPGEKTAGLNRERWGEPRAGSSLQNPRGSSVGGGQPTGAPLPPQWPSQWHSGFCHNATVRHNATGSGGLVFLSADLVTGTQRQRTLFPGDWKGASRWRPIGRSRTDVGLDEPSQSQDPGSAGTSRPPAGNRDSPSALSSCWSSSWLSGSSISSTFKTNSDRASLPAAQGVAEGQSLGPPGQLTCSPRE